MAIRVALAVVALMGSMLVAAGCGTAAPPTIELESLPAATAGQYYEVKFTITGEATVSSSNLPYGGLALVSTPGHGFLFGVPTNPGEVNIHMLAMNGGPTMFQTPPNSERDYTLTVGPATGDSGILFEPTGVGFVANEPVTADLSSAVRGGQPPYRFVLYCVERGDTCADPAPTRGLPPGISMSELGVLSGTIAPKSGVSAFPYDRRFGFIVCVFDAASAHACASVGFEERPPASARPS